MEERRVAILLEYDGGGYAGSQYQPNQPTIQGALEEALLRVTGETARVVFAGRTDAGAHARGQVASFVTRSRLEAPVLQRALNALLARDIAVRDAATVPLEFDVRRAARRRRYRYVIDDRRTRPALERERAWHVPGPLGETAMATAAARLVGRHDFAAFASPPEDVEASTVRELHCFEVGRRGALVVCEVVANAFLPHQVRRMVGALVHVGQGDLTAAAFAGFLEGPAASAGPAAPALGLYLMAVEYEPALFEAALAWDGGVC